MVTVIFRFCIFIMVATIVVVIMTPLFTLNTLLYPLKIDSVYVSHLQYEYEKSLQGDVRDSEVVFLYSPAQLKLKFVDINFKTSDSVTLKGWLAIDTLRAQSPLLIIIPDITEGAINYLPAMKQFCDRGFNVCVIDMRGQGNSEGSNYDFTKRAAQDIIELTTELKKMPNINKVAILGNRTGAAIAIKATYDSASFADVLILQNPSKSLSRLFTRQATEEWGEIIQALMPALKRSYEQQTGISIEDYNYEKMIKSFYIPQMMVAANFNSKNIINETVAIYHASAYYRKGLYIENDSYMKPTGFENSKKYYDKISVFINSSIPSGNRKTRFRKLVMN